MAGMFDDLIPQGRMISDPPITTPRDVPVPSSKKVWGDAEAEAAGLYETAGPAPAQQSVPLSFDDLIPGGDNFADRFGGMTKPANAAELKAALGKRQTPFERGRSEAEDRGPLAAVLAGASEGAAGNLPDYPQVLAAGVTSLVSGEGFSKGLDDEFQRLKGQRAKLAEENPGSTLGGILTGTVLPAIPSGGLISAPSAVGRVLQSAGVGAALGGLQGAAGGEGLEDRLTKGLRGAEFGAVLGGGGEAVLSGLGRVASKAFGGARQPAEGVVPAERLAAAQEFGVPLTRGQATGNLPQQAYEESARNSARGPFAGEAVRGVDAQQAKAIAAAKDEISAGLGGAATPEQAGEGVAQALRARSEGFRSAANEAYERAAGKDVSIASDEVAKLGQDVAGRLEANGIKLDTYGNYGGSQAAMNLLRRVAGFQGAADGKVVAQSLQGLEQARKGLIKIQPTNGEDARALKEIKRAFDDWTSNAVDKKLFSGDATALDDLKEARSLWTQYRGLTKGKGDDALPIISKIVNEERTGQEVANWLLGTSGAGQTGRSARVAAEVRSHLGATSPEFEALKQAAWVKIANPTRGEGAQAVAKSILDFTRGEGAPLARVLFKPDEIAKMQRLAGVLKMTVTDARATNRGQSGYEIARLVEGKFGLTQTAIGAGAAWQTGDPKYLALAGLPLLRSASSLSKGIAATRPIPSQVPAQIARSANMVGSALGSR